MIVSFGLDVSALDVKYSDEATRRAVHRRAIEHWLGYGMLVADEELVGLREAIDRLPQALRKLWQDALAFRRFRPGKSGWLNPQDLDSLDNLSRCRGDVSLLVLEETRAFELGLPEGEGAIKLSSHPVELCRLDYIDQCHEFLEAKTLASGVAPAGQKVSTLWRQRFEPLSKQIRGAVNIVDRFAGIGHLDRHDEYSGLRRFLTELDGGLTGRVVNLFTGYDKPLKDDIQRSIKDLSSTIRRGGIRELNLFLCEDFGFRKIAHYRYVRFDHLTCFLDVGLEAFSGDALYRDCRIQMRITDSPSRENEGKLRAISHAFKLK